MSFTSDVDVECVFGMARNTMGATWSACYEKFIVDRGFYQSLLSHFKVAVSTSVSRLTLSFWNQSHTLPALSSSMATPSCSAITLSKFKEEIVSRHKNFSCMSMLAISTRPASSMVRNDPGEPPSPPPTPALNDDTRLLLPFSEELERAVAGVGNEWLLSFKLECGTAGAAAVVVPHNCIAAKDRAMTAGEAKNVIR